MVWINLADMSVALLSWHIGLVAISTTNVLQLACCGAYYYRQGICGHTLLQDSCQLSNVVGNWQFFSSNVVMERRNHHTVLSLTCYARS